MSNFYFFYFYFSKSPHKSIPMIGMEAMGDR